MALLFVRLASILFAGLVAGATVCVLLIERSLGDSGSFYVLYKQRVIPALTVPLPLIAMLAVLTVAIDAYVLWRDPAGSRLCLGLALAGLALLVGGGILTKAGHFPINDRIMTWDPAAPPADWSAVQAKWATFHVVRTAMSTLAFAALTLSNLLRGP
jgi:uncharacterized membrane protein